MELTVVLMGNEAKFIKKKKIVLEEANPTLRNLENEISSVFHIPPKYQQLFIKDNQQIDVDYPLNTALSAIGLNPMEKVLVKHAHLDLWEAYVNYNEVFQDKKNIYIERKKVAIQAIENSRRLEDPDTKFFVCYTDYSKIWTDTFGHMSRFIDKTRYAMQKAANSMFGEIYSNAEISFAPKKGGTRSGIIVIVTHNAEVTNYYMKTYHHAGPESSSSTAERFPPDFREMFVYRLLEKIKAGSNVFFPFYSGSKFIHYIATEEVNSFIEVNKIKEEKVKRILIVEAYLLSLILGIQDVNEGNFGINNMKMLSIIDFCVPKTDNFLRQNIFDDFTKKNNFGGIDPIHDILADIKLGERLGIGHRAILRWRLIQSVTSDIISNEKKKLRDNGLEFITCTNDVNNYVKDIKKNFDVMFSRLVPSSLA